jgi:DNA-binding NarL/FixJ family response regulator
MSRAILAVDDEPPMLARLGRIVSSFNGSQTALHSAGNVVEAKALASSKTLDMALVDLGLPDGNGIELVRWLRAREAQLPILVISMWSTEEMILGALRAGASGYVLKERNDVEIGLSLKNVMAGGAPIDPFIARRILGLIGEPPVADAAAGGGLEVDEPLSETISKREREILALVASGLSNREIAEQLHRSYWTICTHIRNIYQKLAVNTRVQAVHAARLRGWVR